MEAIKKYTIYEFVRIMGSDSLAMEKSQLKGFESNRFDTEEQAIKYLVDHSMTYVDYVILPIVCITSFN